MLAGVKNKRCGGWSFRGVDRDNLIGLTIAMYSIEWELIHSGTYLGGIQYYYESCKH